MQPAIDFVGLSKLSESERREFEKEAIKFYRDLNKPADITIHINKQRTGKVILNARIIMDHCVLNFSESDYDALIALFKLFGAINEGLRAKLCVS